MADRVGKAFVSTWASASVIQYWGVRGANIESAKVASNNGSLLIRYDRSRCPVFWPSFRKTALARTSKEARIRSIVVFWISP
jgi:hypothetical protein